LATPFFRKYQLDKHINASPLRGAKMHLFWTLLFALVVGLIAKLITPDARPIGLFLTTVLGTIGALLAAYGGNAIGIDVAGGRPEYTTAIGGAMVVLVIYRLIVRESP
jgi:uncharacterized membrane protein YeaQ/YmgE (transglycosylase-associated protein family)